jgi:hypothetical protein
MCASGYWWSGRGGLAQAVIQAQGDEVVEAGDGHGVAVERDHDGAGAQLLIGGAPPARA